MVEESSGKVTICEIISFRRNPLERVLFIGRDETSPRHTLADFRNPRRPCGCGPLMFGAHKSNFEKQITPFPYTAYTVHHNSCAVNLIIIPSRYTTLLYIASDNLCMASVSDIYSCIYSYIFALHPRPLQYILYIYIRLLQ